MNRVRSIIHPLLGADAVAGFLADGHWRGRTVADELMDAARVDPDALAVVGSVTLSRAELEDRARRLAGHLRSLGVGPGAVLVAPLAYDATAVVVTVASSLLGTRLLGVARDLPLGRIERLLHRVEVGAVLVDRSATKEGREAYDELLAPYADRVVVVDREPGLAGAARLDRVLGDVEPDRGDDGDASTCSVLIATGGTTGEPKLVQQHDDSLLYSSRQTIAHAGIGPGDVYLGVGPFGHIMTYFATYIALASRVPLAPVPGWRRGTVAVEVAAQAKPTVSMMTSTHAYDLLQLDDAIAGPLTTLTRIMAAGKPDEFFADLESKYDLRMLRLYGLSEVGTHVHVALGDDQAVDADGRPTPGTTARVVDAESGSVVADGAPGELQVRGPSMSLGYFENDAATAAAMTEDGFWCTGDLATVDPGGYVRICGRLKESIRRGGITIAPDEIESLLFAHPDVIEACVVGTPDPRLGQLVNAVVVPRGRSLELEDVRSYLLEHGIPKKELPDRLVEVDEIPRTDLGRLSKRLLVDQLRAAGRL